MKSRISKKEIQGKISDSVSQAISLMEVKAPSKKVKKIIKRASKKIASKVSRQIKNSTTKKVKVPKAPKLNGKKKEKVEIVA
jgi:hypothetical protein